MEAVAAYVILAAIAFATTNVDDLVLLIGLFADPRLRGWHVVLGQYVGIGALYAAGLVGVLFSLVIPPAYIGLLGLAPIVIGTKKLWDLRKAAATGVAAEEPAAGLAAMAKWLPIAIVTVANGGDNIAVYIPLFASSSVHGIAIFGLTFAAMTAVWCLIAQSLVNHRALRGSIRRYGDMIAPLVLIGLGLFILLEVDSRW